MVLARRGGGLAVPGQRTMDAGILLLGLLWGAGPWLVAADGSLTVGLVALLFPLGASGINVVFNAASRLRFHLFQAAALLPVIAWVARQDLALVRGLAFCAVGIAAMNTALHSRSLDLSLGAIRAQLRSGQRAHGEKDETARR